MKFFILLSVIPIRLFAGLGVLEAMKQASHQLMDSYAKLIQKSTADALVDVECPKDDEKSIDQPADDDDEEIMDPMPSSDPVIELMEDGSSSDAEMPEGEDSLDDQIDSLDADEDAAEAGEAVEGADE